LSWLFLLEKTYIIFFKFEKTNYQLLKSICVSFLLITISVFSQEDSFSVENFSNINNLDSVANVYRKNLKKNVSTPQLISYSKILKQLGKIDSSYYYLNRAKATILKSNNKDSVLYFYTLKAELARFDANRYLMDKTLLESEKFFKSNSKYNFNSEVFVYYLNRKAAFFNEFHDGNKDTLDLILGLTNKVLKLEHLVKDKSIIAYSLNEKAKFYESHGSLKESLKLYYEALEYAKKNKIDIATADIARNIARYHQAYFQDIKTSVEFLEKAFEASLKTKNMNQLYTNSRSLAEMYEILEEYENAYRYKKLETNYLSDIYNLRTSNLLKSNEYNLRFKEQNEIIKNKTTEAENSKRYLALLLVIVFLVVLGLFTMYFYNLKIKRNNKALKELSNENKFLLSEANHRINTNLQLVIILIADQLKKLNNEQQSNLKNLLSKVDSIATLHRHLYKNTNKETINIKDYLKEILINFNELLNERNIKVDYKISTIYLNTDTAMYFGLLLTELIINSMKHAFGYQKQKQISFALTEENGLVDFKYSDNGTNSKDLDIKPKLIDKICRQLKVKLYINTTKGFLFTFKKQI
jgi:two-component sensor histidine kinase